jgi:amidophosphoribosyltransferase
LQKNYVAKILTRASKNLDGYAMAGLLGHGDSFVLETPAGIRPAYFYQDDEVKLLLASERQLFKLFL